MAASKTHDTPSQQTRPSFAHMTSEPAGVESVSPPRRWGSPAGTDGAVANFPKWSPFLAAVTQERLVAMSTTRGTPLHRYLFAYIPSQTQLNATPAFVCPQIQFPLPLPFTSALRSFTRANALASPLHSLGDSYFQEQLANDIGAVNRSTTWPINCIDWEIAAERLQQVYSSVDFNGVRYWIRS